LKRKRASKAPNPKLQAPEKHQAPKHYGVWSLEFGISLVLGAWDLEL
jgi:hypothetical protein